MAFHCGEIHAFPEIKKELGRWLLHSVLQGQRPPDLLFAADKHISAALPLGFADKIINGIFAGGAGREVGRVKTWDVGAPTLTLWCLGFVFQRRVPELLRPCSPRVRVWRNNSYRRYSHRQRGGGFGTLPTGPASQTNSIETQQYYNWGFEPRLRHDYHWLGQDHTVSVGMMLYQTYSPRIDAQGSTPSAMTGDIRRQINRYTNYYSVFLENLFRIDKLSITPGVRLESIWQSVRELQNVDKAAIGQPLSNETDFAFVPLFGLGLEYAFTPQIQAYANVSQAYRPAIFTQAVPTGPNLVVDGNLNPSFILNYEIGFRGDPTTWLTWDTSFFMVDFQDQIGTRTADGGNLTIIENSGRSFTYGWDLSVQTDLVGLAQAIWNPMPVGLAESASTADGKQTAGKEIAAPVWNDWVDRYGSLSVLNNLTLMSSEFISGPNQGNTPEYTPNYMYRFGLTYNWRSRFQVALLGTFIDSTYPAGWHRSRRPSQLVCRGEGRVLSLFLNARAPSGNRDGLCFAISIGHM